MVDIPTLTTNRLILRPTRLEDWQSYLPLMKSDRTRYMGGPFTDLESIWGMFCADYAQWHFFGFGALMITPKDQEDQVIGQVSINSEPVNPEKEIGWVLESFAEGYGYAFEAATALRDWVRQERSLPTLVSYIDPENTRSQALAIRMGAYLDPDAERPTATDLVFRHFGTQSN